MRKTTKAYLDGITDFFSGADGCIGFTKLIRLVGSLDKQAEEGDADAKEIIELIKRFYRFINVVNLEE